MPTDNGSLMLTQYEALLLYKVGVLIFLMALVIAICMGVLGIGGPKESLSPREAVGMLGLAALLIAMWPVSLIVWFAGALRWDRWDPTTWTRDYDKGRTDV